MSTQASDVIVKIDDRIRLLSVALAATNHPEKAQQKKRHQPHAHARGMRKYMLDHGYDSHPAVQGLQEMLDRDVPLTALYTLVMMCEWQGMKIKAMPPFVPNKWNDQLWDLFQTAKIKTYWENDNNAWEQAEAQSKRVFDDVQFRKFLEPFIGKFKEKLIFMPNLGYPADEDIGIRVKKQLIAITAPPLAWGDSPPWPYDEESMYHNSYHACLDKFGRLLLHTYLHKHADKLEEASKKAMPVDDKFKAEHPTWEDQFTELFVSAIVAIYLEDHMSKGEARSYILMEKKAHGMTILPGAVSVMRRYLQEVGNRYDNLIEFLPIFPSQLRVAKKIVKS